MIAMVTRKRLTRVKKLLPYPRVGDSVEMIDFSKVAGRVTKIVPPQKVVVEWGEGNRKVERVDDLALVMRKR